MIHNATQTLQHLVIVHLNQQNQSTEHKHGLQILMPHESFTRLNINTCSLVVHAQMILHSDKSNFKTTCLIGQINFSPNNYNMIENLVKYLKNQTIFTKVEILFLV